MTFELDDRSGWYRKMNDSRYGKASILVWVKKEIKDELKVHADKNMITVQSIIEGMINYCLEELKAKGKKKCS